MMILDKRANVHMAYYNGDNKQEVIDFFMHEKTKHFGKNLKVIGDELHFVTRDYHSRDRTYIKPNFYIRFKYDEDDGWYPLYDSEDDFKENYIIVV